MKHKEGYRLLKIANGQIKSAIKMLEEERYCIDISNQIQATISLLSKAQGSIISDHLKTCVTKSIELNDVDSKIEEINALIQAILK